MESVVKNVNNTVHPCKHNILVKTMVTCRHEKLLGMDYLRLSEQKNI